VGAEYQMKLGIVGGLGPLASSYFYELITTMSDVDEDQKHLELILYSNPVIPDRTGYILNHNKKNPLPYLIKTVNLLDSLSVDYISIPCVTAHYFLDDLKLKCDAEIIDLIEELIIFLQKHAIKRVGILATEGTIQSRFLQKSLEDANIECIIPGRDEQKKLMIIIYKNIKMGKKINSDIFYSVADSLFRQGAEINLLACTELSIVNKELKLNETYLDLLELLAYASLKKCGIPRKTWRDYNLWD
jgi:aspartate racemase